MLKCYKGKLIWPEEDDISVEPRQNVFVIPRPVLIDKKRQFFQVPDDVLMKANTGNRWMQLWYCQRGSQQSTGWVARGWSLTSPKTEHWERGIVRFTRGLPYFFKDEIKFVDFAELLKTRDDDSLVMSVKNVDDVPSLSVTKSEKRSFLTYNQWYVAFEIFVAIHSMKFRNDTPGLMKYASLIRLLHTNGQGWYKYNRSFRQLRSLDASVPWSKIKSTLWSVATLAKAPRVTPVAHDKLPQYNGPPFRSSSSSIYWYETYLHVYNHNNNIITNYNITNNK